MTPVTVDNLRTIPLVDLVPDPQNPRRDVGDISELTASVRMEGGVVEPIIVRPLDGKFAVVVGRRRWAAAKAAGLKEILAVVRPYTDTGASAASLIENLQRKDLEPLEEAAGYKSWLALTRGTQEQLATALGKARPTIANALRLLEAPKVVQDALREKRITAAHARVALSVAPEIQDKLLQRGRFRRAASVEDFEQEAHWLNRQAANAKADALARVRDAKAAAARKAKAPVVSKPTAKARKAKAKIRENARRKKIADARTAAREALNGKSGYRRTQLRANPKLLKGGIWKEPARLVLFAIVTRQSYGTAQGWRPQLWNIIAKLPLSQVRLRAAQWGVAAALWEIGSRQDEKPELTRLVFEHYGIPVPAPKTKARKKAT